MRYNSGYMFSSQSDLTDAYGNYKGSHFKIPSFNDSVVLRGYSGNGDCTFYLIRNDNERYVMEIGVEINIPVELEDTFYIDVVAKTANNTLFSYEIAFRAGNFNFGDGLDDLIESTLSSDSSSSS